jgi:membrane-bound lytic murein transglycosylase F
LKIKLLKKSLLSILLALLIVGCSNENKKSVSPKIIKRDLAEIQEEGILRALTIYSGTSYFLYKGKPMGYEFELLERFAEYLGVSLELIVVKNIDELIQKLNSGEADILSHGLTITAPRKKLVDFTDYLYLTHQVLVQKKPDNWRTIHWSKLKKSMVHDAIELIGDTVSLRKYSSYKERISNLSSELGGNINVNILSGELATDEIIKMVVDGKIKYTVADDNIASIMASYYPILNIEVPISFS